MDTEPNKQQLFDLIKDLCENGVINTRIGKLDGEDFIVFESWDEIALINARLAGFQGPVTNFWERGDNLVDRISELRKEVEENPNHYGVKAELKRAQDYLLYKQYLATLEEDPPTINDFRVETGFDDEYDFCCGCGNVIRTSADSYCWTPPLFVDCGGYACDECVEKGDYDDYLLDQYKNEQKSIPESFDLDRLGLVQINEDSFQNGWYGGQCDTPEPIIKALNAENIDVWFKVYPRQFDLSFDVYVKAEDEEKAKVILNRTDTTLREDPAEVLKRGLQAASKQSAELQGKGIVYSKINSDGTAETRLVSDEEFIKGIKDK